MGRKRLGALAPRFVVFTLKKSFYGKEDHALFESRVLELPGILKLEKLSSPVGAFLNEPLPRLWVCLPH